MKILILEDSLERIEFFKRVYKQHDLIFINNIKDAKQYCQQNEIDIMFLDHDLEPNNLEAIDKCNTGYDFVKWIVSQNYQTKAIFYIHSCNPVGANLMLNLFKTHNYNAEWFPFYLMYQQEKR